MQRGSAAFSDAAWPDDLELTDALRELREAHGCSTTYPRLWSAVVNGRVPAIRLGRRWRLRRVDLPNIAAALSAQPVAAA